MGLLFSSNIMPLFVFFLAIKLPLNNLFFCHSMKTHVNPAVIHNNGCIAFTDVTNDFYITKDEVKFSMLSSSVIVATFFQQNLTQLITWSSLIFFLCLVSNILHSLDFLQSSSPLCLNSTNVLHLLFGLSIFQFTQILVLAPPSFTKLTPLQDINHFCGLNSVNVFMTGWSLTPLWFLPLNGFPIIYFTVLLGI